MRVRNKGGRRGSEIGEQRGRGEDKSEGKGEREMVICQSNHSPIRRVSLTNGILVAAPES